jgi:hypothetical protein
MAGYRKYVSAYLRSDEEEASQAFGKATEHIFSMGVAAGA